MKKFAALATLAMVVFDTNAFAAEPLKSPVDVFAQRSKYSESSRAPKSCPTVGHLPRELTAVGFYIDPPVYSKVDPAKEKAFYEAMKPIRDAEEAMARGLSEFVRSTGSTAAAAGECVLSHLLRFATDGAMLQSREYRSTGQVRLFAVPPLFAYVVLIAGGYPITADDDRRIKVWIRGLAENLLQYQRNNWYGNNIDYWGAGALSLAAVALQDHTFMDAASQIVSRAASEITEQGTLPREMARGDRALEYSLSATQALSVTIAVTTRNSIAPHFTSRSGPIARLMRTMVRAVAQPESFVALSGNEATISPDRIYAQVLAWIAFARTFLDDQDFTTVYCRYAPLYSFRAGGDWGIFYGSPAVCAK